MKSQPFVKPKMRAADMMRMEMAKQAEHTAKQMAIVTTQIIHEMNVVVLIVMHDRYNFDRNQLLKVYAELKEEWDAIEKKYVKVQDMEKALLDETGIDVSEI